MIAIYVWFGIPTTIKTMGVNITTIAYLRVLIIEIGSNIIFMIFMLVDTQGMYIHIYTRNDIYIYIIILIRIIYVFSVLNSIPFLPHKIIQGVEPTKVNGGHLWVQGDKVPYVSFREKRNERMILNSSVLFQAEKTC